jgi:hypothetical protein
MVCCAAVLLLGACGKGPAVPLADTPQWLEARKKSEDARLLLGSGAAMGRAQAEDVGRWLEESPGDLVARRKLLIFLAANGTRFYDPAMVVALRRKHILWLIEHHPEEPLLATSRGLLIPPPVDQIVDPEGYAQARKLWLATVAKPDVSLAALSNAAAFLDAADKPLAEKILLQAQSRDPQGHWAARLGKLYGEALADSDAAYAYQVRKKLEETNDPELLASAGGAYIARALQLDPQSIPAHQASAGAHRPADGSPASLALQAQSSYDQGDWDAARQHAQRALRQAAKLPKDPDYGTAIYQANMVLGMLAMRDGDRKAAVEYMLEASGAPPTEELAYAMQKFTFLLPGWLLKDGERESVVQFLERFAKTCVAGRKDLLDSAELIRRGQKPIWYPFEPRP